MFPQELESLHGLLVSWSLTSLFSTNMAISETITWPVITLLPVWVRSVARSISVCLSAHISQKPHVRTSRNVLWPCLSLPLLTVEYIMYFRFFSWTMLYFCIIGHMAHGVGNNGVGSVLKQVVKISHGTTLWLSLHVQWQQIMHCGEVWCLQWHCFNWSWRNWYLTSLGSAICYLLCSFVIFDKIAPDT